MKNNCDDLTVFYDGKCPLCSWEINQLKNKDTQQRITFEDIHTEQFQTRYPDLNPTQLDQLLHVQKANGQWATGLDATYLLWKTVGYKKFIAPLKWGWLRLILNPCYKLFAKHRHTITKPIKALKRLFTKQASANE